MTAGKAHKQNTGQIVVLIVIAVVLFIVYLGMGRYIDGQKDMLAVETRGLSMIQGLTKYRQDTNALPDTLDKLVPKYTPAVARCPDGQPIAYQPAGNDYTLSCQSVVFKMKPYSYDSRSHLWNG
jgi:hypothetical protein